MIIDLIRKKMWEFQFHYALEPEEMYIGEFEYFTLLIELDPTLRGAMGFDVIDSDRATLLGMMLFRHFGPGPNMLIHRKDNTVWGWIGPLDKKGVWHHVVLGDEEFAMYSEIPR